jgi:hypothetical protein
VCGLNEYDDEDVEELDVEDLHRIRASHACDAPRKGSVQSEVDDLIYNTGDLFTTEGFDVAHYRGDRYSINGRKVRIFILPEGTPIPDCSHNKARFGQAAEMAAGVMVHDGPLRQPLLDYICQTGKNEHYDRRGTENPVEVSGHAKKLEYSVAPKALGDRIHAMKEATAQADMRRKTASAEQQFLYSTPVALETPANGTTNGGALFGARVR